MSDIQQAEVGRETVATVDLRRGPLAGRYLVAPDSYAPGRKQALQTSWPRR